MKAAPAIASSVMLDPLRKWQDRALDMAVDVLVTQNEPYLYVSAPPGSGKSRLMYEIGDLDVQGVRILIVGYRTIVNQHRVAFENEFGCTIAEHDDEWELLQTPRGDQFIISTWQGLAARAARGENPGKVGILFFDECHIGGSDSNNLSIPAVMEYFAPSKCVFVSATLHNVSETLLAPKDAAHTFAYTWEEAYEDGGIINDINLVEVHTGLKAQIERVERACGQTFSELEELEGDELSELAKKLKDKSVDIQSAIPAIVQYNHRAMIELYMRHHSGKQAIFFTPTIEMADWAAAQFNSKARRMGIWQTTIAHSCHTGHDQVDETIERFRNGEITVLFVVNMLQEGFDLKSLYLAFDCRFYRDWSVSRIARLIQKIGRVSRYEEGKPVSQYYYSRDLKDFYNQGIPESPNLTLAWNRGEHHESKMIEEDHPDFDLAQDAATAVAQIRYVEGRSTADTVDVSGVRLEDIRTEDFEVVGRVKTISIPLYILRRSRDWKAVKSFSARGLFGKSAADVNKAKLLAIMPGSPRPSIKTRLGSALTEFTNKKKYDPVFDAAIRARQPAWFINTADEKKAIFLAMPEGSPPPKGRRNTLRVALSSYTRKAQTTYDPVFDAAIRSRHPAWFVNMVDEKKAILLAMPEGSPRPVVATDLGSTLCRITNPNSGSFDPIFDAAIRARQPEWFINTASIKKAKLLSLPEGCPRPSRESGLGNYISESRDTYDAEFSSMIRAKQPQWFVNTANEKKNTLLSLPEGCPRPPYDGLGKPLSWYTASKSRAYDPVFDSKIRSRQPGWFISADEKKLALLALPEGISRSKIHHDLRARLNRYTGKSQTCYDPEFDEKIRKQQPQWFETTKTLKETLLMLPTGSPRPDRKLNVASASLYHYMKNDPAFRKAIIARHPSWFIDKVKEKKILFLSMPENSPRPKGKLSETLGSYTGKNNSSYDEEFSSKIREKQPNWFNRYASMKKSELLSLEPGTPRPNSKQTVLGAALMNYTNQSKSAYDPEFDAAIRKLQPQWFKK